VASGDAPDAASSGRLTTPRSNHLLEAESFRPPAACSLATQTLFETIDPDVVCNVIYFLMQPLTVFAPFTSTFGIQTTVRPWHRLASAMVASKVAVGRSRPPSTPGRSTRRRIFRASRW
jgi:hypothetical protein